MWSASYYRILCSSSVALPAEAELGSQSFDIVESGKGVVGEHTIDLLDRLQELRLHRLVSTAEEPVLAILARFEGEIPEVPILRPATRVPSKIELTTELGYK